MASVLASRKPQQYLHLFPVPYPEFLPGGTDNRWVIKSGLVPAENRIISVRLLSDHKMDFANTPPKQCLRKFLVSDKGLISKMYREVIKFNTKKNNKNK